MTDNDTDVAPNSGWRMSDDDQTAGHVRGAEDSPYDEATKLVQLPTGPVDDRDPGVPPACSYCNADQQVHEREGQALRTAVGDGETVRVRYERYGDLRVGTVRAIETKHEDGWQLVVDLDGGGSGVVSFDNATIQETPYPDDVGINRADYGILGVTSEEILAYGCHACVQG